MIREGLIPVLLGSAVTASGMAFRSSDMKKHGMSKKQIVPLMTAGIIGFGLAHIVLGGIDLFQGK